MLRGSNNLQMVSSTRHRSEVAETPMSLKKKPGGGGGGSSVRPQQICEGGGKSCKQSSLTIPILNCNGLYILFVY
jgi:hypothetical protein